MMRDDEREGLTGLDMPLTRLLVINLAIGMALAVLLVGGLLLLNPGGLRDLILGDRAPGVALGLLVFGFVITLGSTAMGTAIMAVGGGERDQRPGDGLRMAKQRIAKRQKP